MVICNVIWTMDNITPSILKCLKWFAFMSGWFQTSLSYIRLDRLVDRWLNFSTLNVLYISVFWIAWEKLELDSCQHGVLWNINLYSYALRLTFQLKWLYTNAKICLSRTYWCTTFFIRLSWKLKTLYLFCYGTLISPQ